MSQGCDFHNCLRSGTGFFSPCPLSLIGLQCSQTISMRPWFILTVFCILFFHLSSETEWLKGPGVGWMNFCWYGTKLSPTVFPWRVGTFHNKYSSVVLQKPWRNILIALSWKTDEFPSNKAHKSLGALILKSLGISQFYACPLLVSSNSSKLPFTCFIKC